MNRRAKPLVIADLLPHLAHKDGGLKLSEAFDAEKLNIILGHEPVLADPDKEDDKGYYVADLEAFKWWVTLTWALDYLDEIGHEIEEVHEYQDYIDKAKELKGL